MVTHLNKTAKLHVAPELAELIKIYCVLHNKNMQEFTNQILERELTPFKEQLEQLREIRSSIH